MENNATTLSLAVHVEVSLIVLACVGRVSYMSHFNNMHTP